MDEEIKQDTAPEQLDETQNEDTKDIQSQNEENSNNIDEIKSNEGQEKKFIQIIQPLTASHQEEDH